MASEITYDQSSHVFQTYIKNGVYDPYTNLIIYDGGTVYDDEEIIYDGGGVSDS